jgi:hypothetical protein
MKRLGICLLMLLFGMQAGVLIAQAPVSTLPTFALVIEEKPLSAENAPGTFILLVKYTNISDAIQKDDCVVSPAAYKLVVLRDGLPAEKRRPHDQNTEDSPNPKRIERPLITESDSCHGITRGIDPGKTVKFSLWVSSEYDLTAPGTYEITVTRETDRWHPERSVTVKSNTITIVVPEPEAGAAK